MNPVKTELEQILNNLSDAGCGSDELERAKLLYEVGDAEALIQYFRQCRNKKMDELHESQRKVDCLDFLIRRTAKAMQQSTCKGD